MVESGNKCAQFGLFRTVTVVLIEITIWDAVLIWLNGGDSSKVYCVVAALIWHIYFLTLPSPKGSISAQKLAMVTSNEVAL